MSSALNQVFGGGGILGAALNVASMFFPPLAIMNGLGNMLTQAIGGAISGAVDQLCKEAGLPKFVADIVKNAISQALPGLMKPCDNDCSNHVKDKCGDKFQDFQNELMGDFKDAFNKYKSDCEKSGGGSKAGGKSWFVALMQALGEVQNKQAAKVEKLSKEVSDLLGAGDDSNGSKQAQFDKMEEFKAEGKLQEVLANVTKSIGDSISGALSTVARAQ
jgi:hypothetical protein